ncbi:MAG: aspartate ammonia-lyase [Bacteroides sp.]|nr:aspartate ammonia-lyase [Bacteroides sp.]
MEQNLSKKTRTESDLIGSREVPESALYGVQTLRGIENFRISKFHLNEYPLFIQALAITKMGAAVANRELDLLTEEQTDAILRACKEILEGKHHEQFPVDMIQGGAGTTTNMNINEVVANRALELMGHQRGEYQYCSPNDHVNRSQSTNDAYPTAIHIGLYYTHLKLVKHFEVLIEAFRKKGSEFAHIIKMGRTQLEDAVPMTLGQTFNGFASILEHEVKNLDFAAQDFLTVNMGATAIGTGITAEPEYAEKCIAALRKITGLDINMPGKVNPVIPEVMNQVAYKVIGNDLCVAMSGEAAQMELNAMEPVMAQCCFESADLLMNGFDTLRTLCIDGITANEEKCRRDVHNSIGVVTALNPVIGYKNSTKIAKEALETGKGVYELVLEHNILSKKDLDTILEPENMIKPVKLDIHPNR